MITSKKKKKKKIAIKLKFESSIYLCINISLSKWTFIIEQQLPINKTS